MFASVHRDLRNEVLTVQEGLEDWAFSTESERNMVGFQKKYVRTFYE